MSNLREIADMQESAKKQVSNYKLIYDCYQKYQQEENKAEQREKLIIALTYLPQVTARDALEKTRVLLKLRKMSQFNSWLPDLVSAATLKLVELVDRRLEQGHIKDGEHLVNSLRKALRKAARQEFWFLFHPTSGPRTRRDGKRPVSIQGSTGKNQGQIRRLELGHTTKHVDAHWPLVAYTVQEARRALSGDPSWPVVSGLLDGKGKSLNSSAKNAGVSSSTARRRLQGLAPAIVDRAPTAIDKLGAKYLESRWTKWEK